MESGKRLLWPWIVTTLVSLPVLYAGLFGPASMLVIRSWGHGFAWVAYRPMIWLTFHGPKPAQRCLRGYVSLCTSENNVLAMEIMDDVDRWE
jgi:hypothetical protein